jgi:hypothetical protein
MPDDQSVPPPPAGNTPSPLPAPPEGTATQPAAEGPSPPVPPADAPPAGDGKPTDPPTKSIDLTEHDPLPKGDGEAGPAGSTVEPPLSSTIELRARDPQEEVRGDLARGLLWLLTLTIGGVLLFVGTGRIKNEVLTQSIFPSLVTLTGTALGFYFGAQSNKDKGGS